MSKKSFSFNEIYSDGFLAIPRHFLKNYRNKLSPSEFVLMICIFEKTLGFQKLEEQISLLQLVEMSGISKKTCIGCLKSLEEQQFIFIKRSIKEKTIQTNLIQINIDKILNRVAEIALPLAEIAIPPSGEIPLTPSGPSGEITLTPSGEITHTKETKQNKKEKENIYIKATASSFSNKEKSIESCLRLTDQEKEVYIKQHGKDIFDKCYTKIKTWLENTEETKRKNFDYCFKAWALTAVIKDEQILNSFQKGSKKDNTKTNRDYFDDFKMYNQSLCKNIVSNDLCVGDSLAQNKIHFSIDHKEFVKKLNELVNGNQESKILRFKGS